MRSFTRNEIIGLLIIFLAVGAVTVNGLLLSLRRSRDAQRMADLGTISNGLDRFHEEYGFFPPAENGKIMMCKGPNFDEVMSQEKQLKEFDRNLFLSGLRACDWGDDSLRDLFDESKEPYVTSLPVDPSWKDGYEYLYISNMNRYQIYAHLEGAQEEDVYDISVVARNLQCGLHICSVGKGFANTPVDRSIEQFEEELLRSTSGRR